MKKPLLHLEFGVNSLDDIRLLVNQWDEVLSNVFKKSKCDLQCYAIVRVTIEDRVPGQKVLLNFMAPPEVIKEFLNVMEKRGVEFSRRDLIPEVIVKCWIG